MLYSISNNQDEETNLDCEGAGLDAVIPLDALLLPLIVRDVPRELELGVAHAAGAAPGRGGRGCSAPVTLLKLNSFEIKYYRGGTQEFELRSIKFKKYI